MANVTVFDLENYPNNSKTVSVDLTEVVPLGNSGEDVWVFSANTSATASGGAAIQRLYVNNTKIGWAKSSGLKPGPYSITGSKKHLKIAIDEDVADAAEITLDTSATTLGGETVASNMQEKINALAHTGAAKAANLAYLNAIVTYENGFFKIVSGTAAKYYTGVDRSSVVVADGTTTTGLAAELGFDIQYTSQSLASSGVNYTSLASEYTSGTGITAASAGVVAGGDCIAITDGTNTEYRGVESSVGTSVTLSSGLANTYAEGSLVQVMRMQDPTGVPPAAYHDIDSYIKYALSYIVNQIDFSR